MAFAGDHPAQVLEAETGGEVLGVLKAALDEFTSDVSII